MCAQSEKDAEWTGERVQLRPITDGDTERIVQWRNQPSVRRNFLDQRLFTAESHRAWLEKRVWTGQVAQFIVLRRDTGEAIGSVYLRDIDRQNSRCEYGIFLGEASARGHGFGSEACRLACRHAFQTLGLRRVFLRVLADNTAAVRSYEKAGFRFEGRLRRHVCLDGTFHDLILMGLLREEFEAENRDE